MGDMPWLSVPFDGKTRGTIAQLLGVSALPTLLVFDEEQQLITANGRQEIIKDTKAENFPWYPKVTLAVVELVCWRLCWCWCSGGAVVLMNVMVIFGVDSR